jgi:hypothetical protein
MSVPVVFHGSARPARLRGRRFAGVILVAAALVSAACGGKPAPSFDPSGPCVADGRAPHAYPDLEALVPPALAGRPPSTLDSGRNCTAANLGTLASHGVTEIRFAGGIWTDGAQSGITLAVFRAPGLQAEWMGEWYEASARAGRVTGGLKLSKPVIGGRPANRLDLVNGDSVQTVVTWAAAPGSQAASGAVNVVIAADEPESRIQAAIAAFP